MKLVQDLGTELESIVNAHGIDSCIKYCESVYSSSYRTENVLTLSDFDQDCDREQLIRDLTDTAAKYLAVKAGVELVPFEPYSFNDDEGDYYPDSHELNTELCEPYINEAKDLVLKGLQFVEIVNYKGETEGHEVLEVAQNLKLYKGKYNYI